MQVDDSKEKRKTKGNSVNLDSAFNSMKLDSAPSSSSRAKKTSPKQQTKAPEPAIKKNETSLLDLENNTDGKQNDRIILKLYCHGWLIKF